MEYQVVFYHRGCNDGAAAAWCFWRKLDSQYRDVDLAQWEGGMYTYNRGVAGYDPHSQDTALEMLEVGYGTVFVAVPPNTFVYEQLCRDRSVLFLDVSPPASQLEVILSICTKCTIRDHHQSAIDAITGVKDEKLDALIVEDPKTSGATLAWKLAYPGVKIPPLIDLIRIMDNKEWSDMAGSVERSAYLNAERMLTTFPRIEKIFNEWATLSPTMVKTGRLARVYAEGLVKQMAKKYSIGFMAGPMGTHHTVAYLTGSILKGEVATEVRRLITGKDITVDCVAIWDYDGEKDIVAVSLRSPRPGFNLVHSITSLLRNTISAGGHADAASFRFYGIERFREYIYQ